MRIFKTRLVGIALVLGSIAGLWAQSGLLSSLPEKYRKWLDEEAAYIISPQEKEVFLSLATDRERDLFIVSFWKQRDPTPATEENEFKTEHLRRLDVANRLFSTGMTPGWKTEWGRLYTILGDVWPSLRFFEGIKEGTRDAVAAVAASFLHPVISASIEAESDIAREEIRLKEIFNLREVRLITQGLLGFPEAWGGSRTDYVIELDGKTYLFSLVPETPGSRLFGINVSEKGGAGQKPLLETEIVLPGSKAAVFGFQTDLGRTYFLSLKIPPAPNDAAQRSKAEKQAGPAASQERQAVAGDVVTISGNNSPPLRKRYVAPEYPEAAKKARVEGVVMLNVRTDEKGRVEAADIIRSIPLLNQAVVDAVMKWRYQPLVVAGRARRAEFTVSLRFYNDGETLDISRVRIPPEFLEGAALLEEDIARRKIVKFVDPAYPEIARQARVEGFVVLGVRVDEKGVVEAISVLRSIPLLDQATVEAVKQWEFQPPVINGMPSKIAFIATVRFKLI